jgi:hypothetical protein
LLSGKRQFVERVYYNAARHCLICAFGDPFGIVFGEADAPSRPFERHTIFPKKLLGFCGERVRKTRLTQS